jgi:glyoxylase-like metal-dependent hydrolase (beta-lactamase superfamily II)
MQQLLVSRDIDGLGGLDDTLDVGSSDFFVTNGDHAAGIKTANMTASDAGPDGTNLTVGHQLSLFERALYRFDGRLDIEVGGRVVELIEVGPAHTGGDILVHVPSDRTVFTGDILFIEGTPIMWAGPVGNWIEACDSIIALDCETIVPGHGPVTDKRGVRAVQSYLTYIRDEARKRFDAGLSARDAAHDIALGDYDSWGDAERIAVNVASLYREFAHDHTPPNPAELFALMGEIWQRRRG